MLTEFTKQRFAMANPSEREVCSRLATAISRTLTAAERFHAAVATVVADLRAVGHDLWSYDEEDEFEVWGPDYARPSGPGILITFRAEGSAEVTWSSSAAT